MPLILRQDVKPCQDCHCVCAVMNQHLPNIIYGLTMDALWPAFNFFIWLSDAHFETVYVTVISYGNGKMFILDIPIIKFCCSEIAVFLPSGAYSCKTIRYQNCIYSTVHSPCPVNTGFERYCKHAVSRTPRGWNLSRHNPAICMHAWLPVFAISSSDTQVTGNSLLVYGIKMRFMFVYQSICIYIPMKHEPL